MVVYYSPVQSDEDSWSLLTTPDSDNEVLKVPVDEYFVALEKRECTDLTRALQAAEFFLRTGKPDPKLSWETSAEVSNKRLIRP